MQNTNHNDTQRPPLWPQILIAALTLAAVAAALLFGRLTYLETRELAAEQFNQQQLILARSAAAGIESYFQELSAELASLAKMPCIQQFSAESLQYMQHAYWGFPPRTSIRLLDSDGVLRYIYPYDGWHGELVGRDYSGEAYFQDARESGNIKNSGLIINEQGDGRIRIAVPVYQTYKEKIVNVGEETGIIITGIEPGEPESGQFQGVLVGSFDPQIITQDNISPIVSGQTGYAWLLNEEGVFLAHYEQEFVGRGASEVRAERNPDVSYAAIEQIQRRMLAGEEGTGRYLSGWHRGQAGEVEKLVAYTPVHVNGNTWSVAVCAPVSEMDAIVRTAHRAELYTLGFVILALMAGGLYLLVISRRRSHSLEREVEKRTESLHESETHYHLLAENITDIIWTADLSLRFTYISSSITRMLGYSVEEAMALTLGEVFPPASLEVVMQAFTEELAVEEMEQKDLYRSRTLELEYYCKDGSTIWTELKATGLRDPDGQLVEILGVTRDITERVRAEKSLQESESHLQTLINAMPDFVCFKDGGGRWLKANEASIRIFRLEGIDYRGKKDSELAELDSHLRGTFLTCKETDARAWKEGALLRGEETIPHPDGSVRVYDVIKVPIFHPGGDRKGIVVLGRDITERVQAQEKERQHFQGITFLTETVMSFVEFPPDKDIYRFIGERLKELAGESIVVVNSIDEAGDILTTRAVLGMGKYSRGILKLLGRNPEGTEYDARDESLAYLSDGKLHDYGEGLYSIFLGEIPEPVCHAIEKFCRLEKIYTFGFVKGKRLFGTAIIFLSQGAELENEEIIETFVQQASIAIQRQRAQQSLQRRNRELALLNRVIAAASTTLEPKAVLETTCRELALAFDVPQAAAALLNEARTASLVVAEYLAEGRPSALDVVLPVEGNPVMQYVFEHKAPLAITDTQYDPRMANIHEEIQQRGTVSMLILPLMVRGQVVGTLGLDAVERREFSDEEIDLATSAVAAAAQVLENARLFEAERQARRLSDTLSEISRELNATPDLNAALDLVLSRMERVIAFDSSSILLLENEQMSIAAVRGSQEPERVLNTHLDLDTALLNREVIETRRPLVLGSVSDDPRWLQSMEASGLTLDLATTHSWMGVPLLVQDRVIGILTADKAEPDFYQPADTELALAFASHAAVTIEKARLFDEIVARNTELRRLSQAIEQAAEAVVVTDLRGEIEYVNPAFEKITGYSQDEALGQNLRILKSGEHDEAFFREMWQTILAGEVWRGSLTNQRKSGELYHEEMNIAPVFDESGAIMNFIAIKHDVTKRLLAETALRESEQKYRIMIEQSNDMIWTLDIDGNFTFFNQRSEELSGHRFDDWLGKPFAPLIEEKDLPLIMDVFHKILKGEPQQYEVGVKKQDGGTLALSVNTAPILKADQVVGTVSFGRDITKRKQAEEKIQRQLDFLGALHTIDKAITASLDLRITLDVLLDQVITQLGVDAAAVLLLNPHIQTLEYAAGSGFHTDVPQHTHLRLGEGCAGRAVLQRRTIPIPDFGAQISDIPQSAILNLQSKGFSAYYGVPLIAKGQIKGVLELLHRTPLNPDQEWLDFMETLATQAAIAIDNATLFDSLQRSNLELALAYDSTLEGWAKALELRDMETEGHSRRVTEMTMRLARAMGVSGEALVHIRRGALLHDIGKMGVPDSILFKSGKLDRGEWAIMRQHTIWAYKMLSPITYLRPALDIPRYHHEKWDGSGYPEGLRREQIPLPARIFTIVDVWDALNSDRPYRDAWPEDKVREYIQEQSEKIFDPSVVDVFLELIDSE